MAKWKVPLFSRVVHAPSGRLEADAEGEYTARTAADDAFLKSAGGVQYDPATGSPVSGSPASGGAVYYPAVETFGGVMDALAKAQVALAAGKTATVKFLPELYDIASAGEGFPVLSGLTYDADGWRANAAHAPTGGTVIKGNGTFDVFYGNHVDGESQLPDMGQMHALGIYNAHIRNLAILNPRTGVKVGAKWRGGAYKSSIHNVRVHGNTGWGFDLENWQYSALQTLSVGPAVGAVGTGRISGSVQRQIFNHGNLYISDLFSEGGNYKTRGWCIHSYGGVAGNTGSAFNDICVVKAQRNASGQKITVSATMSNATDDILVADASVFPLDIGVTVSVSANGFERFRTYFVVYSQGNVVRLGNYIGGNPIRPSGNAVISLITYGYAAFEFVGYGESDQDNYIQPSTAIGLDAEGTGTNMIVTQHALLTLGIGTVFNGQDVDQASTLCSRTTGGNWTSVGAVITDFDSTSSSKFISSGASRKVVGQTTPNTPPQGMFRSDDGRLALSLAGNSNTPSGMFGLNISGGSFIYPSASLGQRVSTSSGTSGTLNGQDAGCWAYVGNANATRSMPTLSGVAGAANTANGVQFYLCNASTTPGVTLTFNTAANQPFNRQTGKTSVTLQPGQSFSVCGQTNNGSDWFWQVVGNNGVTI